MHPWDAAQKYVRVYCRSQSPFFQMRSLNVRNPGDFFLRRPETQTELDIFDLLIGDESTNFKKRFASNSPQSSPKRGGSHRRIVMNMGV
jgi:hypothetical protein